MQYTNDFKSRVLSVIRDPKIKYRILNGQLDIGNYLKSAAFKGVDSRVILDCIHQNDLNKLKILAREQEITKALYQEWLDFYVMKCTLGQEEDLNQIDNLKKKINESLKSKDIFVDSIEYNKKGKYNFLEITLDKVGGIDLDEIVEATKIINPIADKDDFTKDSYILDISSKERG